MLKVVPLPSVSLSLPFDSLELSQPPIGLIGGIPLGGTFSGPGVGSGQFNAGIAGIGKHTITYHYQDPQSGCHNIAFDTIVVGNWNALNENDKLGFSLYPNPSAGYIILIIPEYQPYSTVQIRNQLGQVAMELPLGRETQIHLDISSLSQGIYFLSVLGKEKLLTRRFILIAR
jgi:hypothetical protein